MTHNKFSSGNKTHNIPAQVTGETSHGSVCVSESHYEESDQPVQPARSVVMVQSKVFDTDVVSDLCACVFLQMWLDLTSERTWKMGPIKCMEDLDPVFFQETFRFTQGEFTEILIIIRDLDGDLLVDENDDPHMFRWIGKTPKEYIRWWTDSVLMIVGLTSR